MLTDMCISQNTNDVTDIWENELTVIRMLAGKGNPNRFPAWQEKQKMLGERGVQCSQAPWGGGRMVNNVMGRRQVD